MRFWGKIFGFLFGFMLTRNIFGGILGLWLGHFFDKGTSINFDKLHQGKEADRQAAFFYCTFSVMGYVAKAKGRVTEHEIAFANAYMDRLGLRGELRREAQEAFRDGKTSGFPLDARLAKFKESCRGRNDLLLLFLEIQIQVAFADGNLENVEREVLHKIARTLGFSARELDQLFDMIIAGAKFHQHQGQNAASPESSEKQISRAYRLLGVKASDTDKDIKKAYRKLMAQHHPDKLVAKGLPKQMMEQAKQKAQDIQSAYEMVQAARK